MTAFGKCCLMVRCQVAPGLVLSGTLDAVKPEHKLRVKMWWVTSLRSAKELQNLSNHSGDDP